MSCYEVSGSTLLLMLHLYSDLYKILYRSLIYRTHHGFLITNIRTHRHNICMSFTVLANETICAV